MVTSSDEPNLGPLTRALIKTKCQVIDAKTVYFEDKLCPVTETGKVILMLQTGQFALTADYICKLGASRVKFEMPDHKNRPNERDLPKNVYVANAASITYAIKHGRIPPAPTFLGKKLGEVTEVFKTIEEALDALENKQFRTEFRRGSRKVKSSTN